MWTEAALAATGVDWEESTNSAEWEARSYLNTLVFDNKLWVMGGVLWGDSGADSDLYFNDVWYSTDGITWTMATSAAEWEARSAASAVVFDDKMWVIGGTNDAGDDLNDVWYSTDGITWTMATSAAEWEARNAAGMVVFDDKMWIMGGYDAEGVFNDVWYSTDGITWTMATSAAEWEARNAAGMVVFDDKMWIMGGMDTNFEGMDDVWYSTDGIAWTMATSAAEWEARQELSVLTFNDKMWIMAGILWGDGGDISDVVYNDVWYSTDGITWTMATSAPEWEARSAASAVVFDDKMWIMGGYDDVTFNDVWFTEMSQISDLFFDEQGGTAVSDILDVEEDDSVTLPTAPSREGYTFLYWNTAADGSGTQYGAGASFTMPSTDTTLYAIWQAEDTSEDSGVTYGSGGGGSSGGSSKSEESGTPSSAVAALIMEHRDIFIAAYEAGITLPQSILALLDLEPRPVAVRDLEFGAEGEDVRALQAFLIKAGHTIPSGATGFFGSQTQAALIAYQRAQGIMPAVGYFGPLTRAHMKAAGVAWWE